MKTKIAVGLSILAFSVSLFSILTAGLVVNELRKGTGAQPTGAKPGDTQAEGVMAAVSPSPASKGALLTAEEIAKHNSRQDCWMIVGGNVYNVTSYISAHPGGAAAITGYCGKDGTTAFQTKGGSGSHSQNAYSILAGYLIGSVGGTSSVNPGSMTALNPPLNAVGGEDENDD